MRQNYKRLGDYIRLVDVRNKNLDVQTLLGVSIQKKLMPSIANTVGTDMSNYKIIQRNQFAYGTVTSRNGDKISIALLKEFEKAIVSQIYLVFEIKDTAELLPDYLMMWFRRPEFDRYARYKSHGSARETFDWNEMIETELPIPGIEKQKELVAEYQTIENRIRLNNELCQKLEETAQTVYRHWFEDFEFPVIARSEAQQNDEAISTNQILQVAEPTAEYQNRSEMVAERRRSYKSSAGKMVYSEELGKEIPEGWKVGKLGDVITIGSGKSLSNFSKFKINHHLNPVVGAGGINGYTDEFNFDEDIIVIGRVGTHGKVQRFHQKCWATDNTLVIIPKYYEYTYQFLQSVNYIELNRGGVQALITQTDIKNLEILLPHQNLIVLFENRIGEIFNKFEILNKQTQKLEELKSLLLGKMAVEE